MIRRVGRRAMAPSTKSDKTVFGFVTPRDCTSSIVAPACTNRYVQGRIPTIEAVRKVMYGTPTSELDMFKNQLGTSGVTLKNTK